METKHAAHGKGVRANADDIVKGPCAAKALYPPSLRYMPKYFSFLIIRTPCLRILFLRRLNDDFLRVYQC